jgi:hypothetical protein
LLPLVEDDEPDDLENDDADEREDPALAPFASACATPLLLLGE